MGYTMEERLDIGKQIYCNELSKTDAAIKYGISTGTARDYMRLYRDSCHLPPKNTTQSEGKFQKINISVPAPGVTEYEDMTKEELIRELLKSRINEARLKKGYEVKGAGQAKSFTVYDNKNTK